VTWDLGLGTGPYLEKEQLGKGLEAIRKGVERIRRYVLHQAQQNNSKILPTGIS